jgi:lysophospholipase
MLIANIRYTFFKYLIFYLTLIFVNGSYAKTALLHTNIGSNIMTYEATFPFTQESELEKKLLNEINTFWKNGHFSSFQGVDNTRINYAHLKVENAYKCLIMVSGRSESYLKYKELSYDFSLQGYDVFIIDHRGQGLSERLVTSPYKGYVLNFQDYVTDLSLFIENVVNKNCSTKPYLLAHSMGGAIAARYMQDHPNAIHAAVLSAPMLGVNAGGVPNIVAETLVKGLNSINQLVSNNAWYLIGQSDYQTTPFSTNHLSHSKLRYQLFTDLYEKTPEIQLGGVTLKWLTESIDAQQMIFSSLTKLSTPLMVLQASEDIIIDNAAQNDFCAALHQIKPSSCLGGKPYIIQGAYHEIFIEKDEYRNEALTQITSWFEQHE